MPERATGEIFECLNLMNLMCELSFLVTCVPAKRGGCGQINGFVHVDTAAGSAVGF